MPRSTSEHTVKPHSSIRRKIANVIFCCPRRQFWNYSYYHNKEDLEQGWAKHCTTVHYGPESKKTLIIHFSTSEGMYEMSERANKWARKRSEQCGTSEWVSGANEQANGWANGPVLTSGVLIILAHSGMLKLISWLHSGSGQPKIGM